MIARIALAAFAGSLMFAASANAGEAEVKTIEAECAAKLGYTAARCTCIAQKAGEQLNDTQQKFMIATITNDQATYTSMQASTPMEEMVKTGEFMTAVPDQCQ